MEHRNTVDVHLWHGPPGLSDEYFRLHKLDPKTPENMRTHPLCLMQKGPAWEANANERDSLMAAHSRYIHQLREQRKLGAAGGIGAPDDLLGRVVFKPGDLEETKQLMEDDPAVKAGVLKVEYHRWWSSEHKRARAALVDARSV